MQNSIYLISTDLILPNVYQPRKNFDEEAIEELAQSIKSFGIIQPLSVRKLGNERYELVAGERRLRAAKKIGLKEVPAMVIDIADRDSAAIALLENLQREDLNFLEEAEAYYNLIQDHSYTQEQLSEIIGKKQSTIANKLRLLKLDENIRKRLVDSELTERHGRALLKLPTSDLQNKVLDNVIKNGLNVKKTEELIEKELLVLASKNMPSKTGKKIKGIFSPRIYINTVKQVFDKCNINAKYTSSEDKDSFRIIVTIPKG